MAADGRVGDLISRYALACGLGWGRDDLISRYALASGLGWGRDGLISRYALASGSGFVARGNRMLAHGG